MAASNCVQLAYEEAGPRDGPVILLIMGLGVPLTFWPEAFVDRLADLGFRVVRFDNRDAGRSTVMPQPPPGLAAIFAAGLFGRALPPAYGLNDMATDAVGLLDALQVPRAHIVGASMGGMIAQHVAALFPARVSSLVLASSSSGARRRRLPAPGVMLRIGLATRSGGRAAEAGALARLLRAISSADADPAFRDVAERIVERGYHPAGIRRQLAAIVADGDRTRLLRTISAPTLVIHGDADRLLPPAHGAEIAKRIPGARLNMIAGMAHDLPPSRVAELADAVSDHAKAAERGLA